MNAHVIGTVRRHQSNPRCGPGGSERYRHRKNRRILKSGLSARARYCHGSCWGAPPPPTGCSMSRLATVLVHEHCDDFFNKYAEGLNCGSTNDRQ